MLLLDRWRGLGVPTGRAGVRHSGKRSVSYQYLQRQTSSGVLLESCRAVSSSSPSSSEASACATADLTAAWELLRDFTLKEFRGTAQDPYLSTSAKRQRLSDAVKLVYAHPFPPAGWTGASPDTEVLLGVLASDIKFAARAYRDWCEELGLPLVPPTSRVEGVTQVMQLRGSVYLKYNSKTQLCYVSRYDGRDRGVLVQMGQLQLGHFPLGLFDESLSKPPPAF